ncbi:probable E3 ubiquitin-protein ligase XERICO [Lycium barbarum]|uniref:probable E3 ubiquitin-protein ligase XERICO n=1 Tax=Lycium barbarum TaxID=112863 RepID=UPI00293EA995|nr:probable E3 ubiquitin-protein ligase XERICO [Lycium barbarum]
MGLSSFPSPAEGMLPVLVMNTVLSAALIKNLLKSIFQMMGATWDQPNSLEEEESVSGSRERRVSITRYESLCKNRCNQVECCVCLNRFKGEEKVSELSCKHFFHTRCLDRWFDNQHTTCPLCRSIF